MKDNFSINKEAKNESSKVEEQKTAPETSTQAEEQKAAGNTTPETPTQVEEPKTAEDTTPKEPKPEIVIGIVSNCPRLRVRKSPSPNAPVLTEIAKGSEVVIDESKPAGDFYSVITENGIDGFCMKEYIQVR